MESLVFHKLFLAATAHWADDIGEVSELNPAMPKQAQHVQRWPRLFLPTFTMASYTAAHICLFTQISDLLQRFPAIVMAFEDLSSSPWLQLCCEQRHSWDGHWGSSALLPTTSCFQEPEGRFYMTIIFFFFHKMLTSLIIKGQWEEEISLHLPL